MSTHNICFHGDIRKIFNSVPPHIWSYEFGEGKIDTAGEEKTQKTSIL